MKKIMMAVAIVCAAVMAQAASVSWTAYQYAGGEMMDYGYCTDLAEGSSIVLCLLNSEGGVAKELQAAVDGGSGDYSNNFSFEYSSGTLKNGDVLKVFVKDSKGNYADLVAAANPEGMDPTTFNTLTASGLADDTWTNDEFVFATGNYSAAAVPEPTSGLLMLVGLAGLALRRRRA